MNHERMVRKEKGSADKFCKFLLESGDHHEKGIFCISIEDNDGTDYTTIFRDVFCTTIFRDMYFETEAQAWSFFILNVKGEDLNYQYDTGYIDLNKVATGFFTKDVDGFTSIYTELSTISVKELKKGWSL